MTTMQIDRAVVEQALEALEAGLDVNPILAGEAEEALRAALAQRDEPEAYGYASRLAVAIWEKHYKDTAPQWKLLDDLMGVLTQIDNMTSGLTRLAQQAEPVEDVLLSAAGLALDALEHDRQAAARAGRSISMLSSRAIEELRGAFRAALAQQDELQPMPPEQRQRWEELAAMPQQAEPLNLADPAVRKRLATQWGYVPAAQAEPVEPVAWKQGNLVTFNEDPYPALGGLFVQLWDGEEVAARVYANDLKTLRQRCAKVNTAPPQRKPLTEEEIVDAVREADLDWQKG